MNFLYSVFGRGNTKTQGSKYDKISFKLNLSEHIPQYYEASNNKAVIQQQITPDHPLYYQIFPKQNQEYIEYQVKQNDTMSGFAIRLDISQKYLRELNGISGSLYPGMMIKLPFGTDLSKLQQPETSDPVTRLRISQILASDKSNTVNHKFTVYYLAGLSGNIKGILTVNTNYIIFNPLLEEPQNLQKFTVQKLLKFNALIEMYDIQRAQSMKIPQIDQFTPEGLPLVKYIVQFMLYRVGDTKVQKKYNERIKQLKLSHKALASVSFSFLDHENGQQKCNQVTAIVNSIIEQSNKIPAEEIDTKKRLTNIPFFDIIQHNLLFNNNNQQKKQQHHIIRQSAILGSLTEQSDIISNEHFQNLAKGFPILYKLYNWLKVYSARRDGSAFSTFLNKTKNIQPAILLIKEYKGNILGAFLVESIEAGKTGRGQMFIFTFRGDSKVPQIYEWTTKNEFFVNLDKDKGIGIGMGIKYGIFIDRTFEKGSSASTNTFGNKDMLSFKQDFLVDQVQLWGVDTSL